MPWDNAYWRLDRRDPHPALDRLDRSTRPWGQIDLLRPVDGPKAGRAASRLMDDNNPDAASVAGDRIAEDTAPVTDQSKGGDDRRRQYDLAWIACAAHRTLAL